MWFKIKSYLLFLLKSTNKHGIHSPFVYNLVTNCFTIKTAASKKQKLVTILNYFKNNNIEIPNITKKQALLLIRIVTYFKPKSILELETSFGFNTALLSIGNPKAAVTTIKNNKTINKEAAALFNNIELLNITLINSNLKNKLINNSQFDFIYFDKTHQKTTLLNNFKDCLVASHNNSVFIFNAINSSKELQEAWEEIKNNPKVTITINTYFYGIVFFRTEQARQHFTIRV
ncbi:class I SAM-dependent methyltransferase [Lutibacter sp. A80]|uniref:class I SAM-dependent methyltransferase n=1 Tax=Lutibacter sp. A80 TaxID=2918453 RepID=UPI001F06B55B|nr:class I SAM-dependent methyltransferase [Lutibacter sp. A80]UMB61358.1 class I SAM-dependent methyltransferase [Lutibacter sp. A80]